MKSCLIFILLLGLMPLTFADYHSTCHPKLLNNQKNHMIGYGSLIETASRMKTNPKAAYAYPIEVKGFKRAWGLHGFYQKTTYLTIVHSKHTSLNAVYYNVEPVAILADDSRERSYCRVRVPIKDIKPLALSTLDSGVYWIYAQKKPRLQAPTAEYPIVQSYVDIFLNGCMQVSNIYRLNQFQQKCIKQTKNWPHQKGAWINDRVHPKRPFSIPNAFNIDELLSKIFPNYYNHPYE